MRRKAIRELRKNYTRKGVWLVCRHRWRDLLFRPHDLYADAARMTEGVFT